jgi:hypothetical protein
MEPEGSLPCSQGPSTAPYPEANQSNPYHLSKIHFNIILPPTSRSSGNVTFYRLCMQSYYYGLSVLVFEIIKIALTWMAPRIPWDNSRHSYKYSCFRINSPNIS